MEPDNGALMLSNGLYIESQATYNCDSGFELSSDEEITILTCTLDITDNTANWNGSIPTCEGIQLSICEDNGIF